MYIYSCMLLPTCLHSYLHYIYNIYFLKKWITFGYLFRSFHVSQTMIMHIYLIMVKGEGENDRKLYIKRLNTSTDTIN